MNPSTPAPGNGPAGQAETPTCIDGEVLGRIVRKVWIEWAKEQPVAKPSWLVEWEGLSEPDKDVDRRIGLAIVGFVDSRLKRTVNDQEQALATLRRDKEELREALEGYMAAVALANEAMKDGINVHGALTGLIGWTDNACAILARTSDDSGKERE